jgi:ATP-dependent Clp protease ATP-binding subunit ClpA
MATLFFPITIVTRIFDDESLLAEALNFPEISRFESNEERAKISVKANTEETLKRTSDLFLHRHLSNSEISLDAIKLEFSHARQLKNWRNPIEINFHFLRWEREDGFLQAFVPAIKIVVITKDKEKFSELIEKEIRAYLSRNGLTKSLFKLRQIARVQQIKLAKLEVAFDHKSPKQRAIEDEKDEVEEKSVLEQVGTNLVTSQLPAAYEVDKYLELLAETLKQNRSVLLIGSSGVGKTAIFNQLVRQRELSGFKDKNFWETSGARLIAGQSGFGMWQKRTQKLIEETKKYNVILYLGNLIELLEVGKSGFDLQGIAGFLRPKIGRGEMLAVVECTPEQLTIIEKRDPHLLSAFLPIKIEEPDAKTTQKILEFVAHEWAAPKTEENRQIEQNALKTILNLHQRYASYSAFPGRPVRFLRNLFSNLGYDEPLSSEKVLQSFSDETGLPLFLLSDEEKLDLDKTEKWFANKVIGQQEAIRLIVDLIAMVKTRLTRPRKPIASLLFIGVTGVGKTEMVKSLAEFFFRDQTRMARFDMSEFSSPLAVQRLIGGVGQTEGLLTAKVREQPFSVILMDEFEKADPSFFDLLLQILGEGRLTDTGGRLADFTNSIIIMTSNLGAQGFQRGKSGFLRTSRQREYAIKHFSNAVREFLRPEIYNRIDRIVPFTPLDEKTVRQIARLEFDKLLLRDGLRFRQIRLEIEDIVLSMMAENGYDVRYGARPLRRTIERQLIAPLSAELNKRPPDEKYFINVSTVKNSIFFDFQKEETGKRRTQLSFIFANLAQQAAELRRQTQKMSASYRLTELNDERFQLVRLQQRVENGTWVSNEDKVRLERLPKIRKFLEAEQEFAQTIAGFEDRVLLEIYDRKLQNNTELAEEFRQNELKFQNLLFDLLALQFQKPNEICLAIFSESPAALFRLSRCYLYCVEEFKAETPEIVCFTTRKVNDEEPLEKPLFDRQVWRKSVTEPEKFFVGTNKETVGIVIKITGVLANPRFISESGLHSFIHSSKTDKVLVISGDFDLQKVTPTERLEARCSIENQTKRRDYNALSLKIKDFLLNQEFDFDGRVIAEVTAKSIEEHLKNYALKIIE